MVKSEDYNAILDILKKRYIDLKEIFMGQTLNFFTAPDFYKREFFFFCKKSGIVDKNIHSGIIDTYFKATNFEEED